jgi:hypothetical protein
MRRRARTTPPTTAACITRRASENAGAPSRQQPVAACLRERPIHDPSAFDVVLARSVGAFQGERVRLDGSCVRVLSARDLCEQAAFNLGHHARVQWLDHLTAVCKRRSPASWCVDLTCPQQFKQNRVRSNQPAKGQVPRNCWSTVSRQVNPAWDAVAAWPHVGGDAPLGTALPPRRRHAATQAREITVATPILRRKNAIPDPD